MKITINENPDVDSIEVIINCKKANDEVIKMIASLNSLECKITGTKDGQTFLIAPDTILYIESVDKKTFIYTKNDVFETVLRLLRMIIFTVPFLVLLTACAVGFHWFPSEITGAWIMFIVIFILAFIGITIGFEIYFSVTGKKYDGLLGQYKKQKDKKK